MRIAEWSVSHPVAVTMRIASLVLLGIVCLLRLPVDLLPRVSIPTVAVSTAWTNVSPEQMETQITRPVEEAVSSADNLYAVQSSSTLGSSTVRVQFNWGTDVDAASVQVLQLVQRAIRSPSWPAAQAALSEPTVFKYDPNSLPIVVYGINGMSDPVKLRELIDNEVTPIIESANGVASATATGGEERAIIINCDPVKLQAYGITLTQVQNAVSSQNVDIPSGVARQDNTEYTIRATGYYGSPPEMEGIPIGSSNGAVVHLRQVASVQDSYQDERESTRLNGGMAVGMIIVKQSGANTIDTANAVAQKVEQVKKLYPQLKFNLVYDQSHFITESIQDLQTTAVLGGALAVIVLLFFLRSIHSTLVVALSIPISIISTFAIMYFGGFTINTISLSGLALATGLIVDDAVVVLENIFRHIERDHRKAGVASVTGTVEIQSAVVASTMTVIIVFCPLFLIKGQAGEMFTQFALVVIFSMLVSLLDATTVVPMLASRLINEEEVEEEAHPELREQRGKKVTWLLRMFNWFGAKFNAMDASYRKTLQWCIHHRLAVVLTAVGITCLSLLLVFPVNWIGSEMLPQTDTGDISANFKLPIGTAYASTRLAMNRVEKIVLANPNVQTFFSAAGTNLSIRGTSTTPVSYYGGGMIHLKDDRKDNTNVVIRQLTTEIAKIPGMRPLLQPYDIVNQILTGGTANMEVDIFGSDNKLIYQKALEVASKLRGTTTNPGVSGLESIDLSIQDVQPEMLWKVDRDKASELGVAFADVGNTLNIASAGALATYYQEGGYQYPIYVQVPLSMRSSADELKNLPIARASQTGPPVLLSQVATPYTGYGPSEVDRLNRTRYVAVTGRVSGRSQSDIMDDITSLMNKEQFSTGMYWAFGLTQQQQGQEFSGLGLTLFLAIALIYMLLASQFESFVYPLVVLMSVPLCIVGVLLALFISGRAFGLTAFIGLLMLVGIAVKNGILLVDYTNQLRGRGLPRDEAILTASPTRLRPILMTSSAAILGMLPLALGLGKGSETQAPLATAVVGGLFTSTLLTLFIVPVVYTFFDDLIRRVQGDKRDLAPATGLGPSVSSLPKGDVDDDGGRTSNGRDPEPLFPGGGAPEKQVTEGS